VANLNARCTVIAAANPLQGRYNETLSFVDNVNLSDPILSRFDIVKVIKDRFDEQIERELSTFVINSHMENHPYSQQYRCQVDKLTIERPAIEIVDLEFLKQYIKYARERFTKTFINDMCADMIRKVYAKLRESSEQSGGIRITTRHLESMIRIC
jgi:DNA replication licensing factor MCM2